MCPVLKSMNKTVPNRHPDPGDKTVALLQARVPSVLSVA